MRGKIYFSRNVKYNNYVNLVIKLYIVLIIFFKKTIIPNQTNLQKLI